MSRWRKALRLTVRAVIGYLALTAVLIPLYAFVNPPLTTVMLIKGLAGDGITKKWTDIDDISPLLVRAVLISEDGRFCSHRGIDWKEMVNAVRENPTSPRGASTITMQTVKNLFLWTGRSYIRKGLEVPLALYAELLLSKKRIMEIYLNTVQWDTGVYGVHAAAKHYFGTTPENLSAMQSVRLAAVLPAPERRNAAAPGPGTAGLAQRIAGRAMFSGPYVSCVLK